MQQVQEKVSATSDFCDVTFQSSTFVGYDRGVVTCASKATGSTPAWRRRCVTAREPEDACRRRQIVGDLVPWAEAFLQSRIFSIRIRARSDDSSPYLE